jgi:2-polyprenyl-6-hydroxyphenyl methylase/3-demethylubiquinone-9 3-methyltransferase
MQEHDDDLDAVALESHQQELAGGRRFDFGGNWWNYAGTVDGAAIAEAERSLISLLPEASVRGGRLDEVRMLDAGCGSGLFSVAALRLGARVTAFDFDPNSVRTTRQMVDTWTDSTHSNGRFRLLHGSVLDEDFLAGLGTFDVVYSWGVLHHTGSMWEACRNVARRVAPGGTLVVALYHDTGMTSSVWWYLKRLYVALPRLLQPVLAVLLLAPIEVFALVRALLQGAPGSYVRRWTEYRSRRGMSRWHDHLDWVGGFPYEYASREEVRRRFAAEGFEVIRINEAIAWGNNEFVLVRASEGAGSAPAGD